MDPKTRVFQAVDSKDLVAVAAFARNKTTGKNL